jgi:hypothetical protein
MTTTPPPLVVDLVPSSPRDSGKAHRAAPNRTGPTSKPIVHAVRTPGRQNPTTAARPTVTANSSSPARALIYSS